MASAQSPGFVDLVEDLLDSDGRIEKTVLGDVSVRIGNSSSKGKRPFGCRVIDSHHAKTNRKREPLILGDAQTPKAPKEYRPYPDNA